MSKLYLKEKPELKDYQQYIAEMIVERGFVHETVPELFMLFLEECGEFAKAARKATGMMVDVNSEKHHNLEHEAADVFNYFLDLCNHLNIDLERAFREKEEINKQRTWKVHDND